jgi:membrane-bound ClpP family serine protease
VIAPVAVAAALFFMFVLRAAIRMRKQRPASEPGPVIGTAGVVVRDLDPLGVVLVAAEEWTAQSRDGQTIGKGSPVRVTKVEGLRLTVQPVDESVAAGAAAGGGDQAAPTHPTGEGGTQ